MIEVNYNPDVLSCLANLSNDEVFTPPKLVNEILDMLPQELFESPETTFLDPVTKSGVFLREIAKRLNDGLATKIPDQQERINHIFKNQVFGIAITELTSLLARRSTYCTKKANGDYSVCTDFDTEEGNIKYDRLNHTWNKGQCVYCGASEDVYKRAGDLETYAYQFIHTEKPQDIFKMKFDVIIGNPPYQLSDSGFGKSAKPIYHKFIEQGKRLNPRFLSMIVPARWYNGGKGLDEFRNDMLSDKRLSELHDFPDTSDCFPGINVRGGVCYFLWDSSYHGDCKVITHKSGKTLPPMWRPLKESGLDIFVRYNEAISILRKVEGFKEDKFNRLISARKPFGLPTNFKGFKSKKDDKSTIHLYRFGENGFIRPDQVEKNGKWVNDWKVLVPKASPGDDSYPHLILSKPIVASPNSACTETYIVVGPVASEQKAKNIANYMVTSFFRFLVLLAKSTQDVTQKTYVFVPAQDFSVVWTDEKLFEKYCITSEEQDFIDGLIRKMEVRYE